MPWWLNLGAPETTSMNWNAEKAHINEDITCGDFKLGKA